MRQRKNFGRLLRSFHDFEFASKCEVPAKNDMEIFLSSWKNLFALCIVEEFKIFLPPSKQLLYHANWAKLIVYMKETQYICNYCNTRPCILNGKILSMDEVFPVEINKK